MDEWETRRRLIDLALEAAGWSPIVRYTPDVTYDPATGTKEAGARRRVAAANAEDSFGRRVYRLVNAPTDTPKAVRSAAEELASPKT